MNQDICIKQIGSFYVGGEMVSLKGLKTYETVMAENAPPRKVDPNGEFWTGQMYVQYVKLAKPKAKYPLCLWHGGGLSGACWESLPNGKEGWQTFFLKAGYDVYISDAVERGRASWSRYPEIFSTKPIFRPYAHAWESFRIGPKYHIDPNKRKPFDGSQFPVEHFDKLMMQAIPRWSSNTKKTQLAYNEYLKKIKPCIIISHSRGAQFAEQAAIDNPDKVKGIVFLEAAGVPTINEDMLKRVKNIPRLYIYGDFLEAYPIWSNRPEMKPNYYWNVREYSERLKKIGGLVDWIELPKIGIHGNTHMMISDMNTLEIANLVKNWLSDNNFMK